MCSCPSEGRSTPDKVLVCVLRSFVSGASASVAVLSLHLMGCESATSTPTYAEKGTCASTCERSVAAACAGGPSSVPTCTAECEAQIAKCTDATVVATYLDCVQSTPMTCGEFTRTASSPECVSPGLTYAACLAGKLPTGSADTVSSTDSQTPGGPVSPPTADAAKAGELVGMIADGDSLSELRCAVGASLAPVVSVQLSGAGEAIIYVSCASAQDLKTDNHTITVAWQGASRPAPRS